MVFTSLAMLVRSKGPDEFWRKRKVFKMAAHYQGRSRNCYSIAIRNVLRALAFATKARAQRKKDIKELWTSRIVAGVGEHGFTFPLLKEGLNRCNVFLNSKVLADLAIWEPRSFKSLTQLAWAKTANDGLEDTKKLGLPPSNVKLRNLKDS